jgi:hypothetical protein
VKYERIHPCNGWKNDARGKGQRKVLEIRLFRSFERLRGCFPTLIVFHDNPASRVNELLALA